MFQCARLGPYAVEVMVCLADKSDWFLGPSLTLHPCYIDWFQAYFLYFYLRMLHYAFHLRTSQAITLTLTPLSLTLILTSTPTPHQILVSQL